MFNLINAHQQEFIWLLNQPSNADDVNNLVNMYNNSLNQQGYQQPQQQPPLGKLVLEQGDEEQIMQLMGVTGMERDKCVKG